MVFADPPYFLSNNGFSVSSGKRVSVNKGDWDRLAKLGGKHKFNRTWIKLVREILKPNGTLLICGTMHNIFSVGTALEQEGFKILNDISWVKTNPPPNLSCRYFVHSTENILWARKTERKSRHYFNYTAMKMLNKGKQMRDAWITSLTPPSEKNLGVHPTQKPLLLLEKIILSCTQENDIVLDPFCGSATTGVACKILNRKFVGIEKEKKYIELARKRIVHENDYEPLKIKRRKRR